MGKASTRSAQRFGVDDTIFNETRRLWHNKMLLLLIGSVEIGSMVLLLSLAATMPQARTTLLLVVLGMAILMTAVLSWGARVTVSPEGLRVRGVTVPVPRWHLAAGDGPKDMATVEAIKVDPISDWGGWGYKWIPRKGSAVLYGGGQGVRITLNSGKIRVISSPKADELFASILALGVPEKTYEPRVPKAGSTAGNPS